MAEALESRRLLAADVLTWHDDPARTGLNSQEIQLTNANVNSASFGKLFSYPVDGQVYAQPLYVSQLAMPDQGTHDVVFAATEHDSVYAFDADSHAGPDGGLLWHVSLGTPATTPTPYIGYTDYHTISPFVGITGTPVIDRSTNTMYVDAFTNDAPGVYTHRLHALDITTGVDKVAPAEVMASVPGDGAGGDGTSVPFVATSQMQRPALTLSNGTLYVAYGSYGDTDPYHGWVLGFDPGTLQLTTVFNTTPNNLSPPGAHPGEGAIWQAGAGLASDGAGLYVMVGNGDFNPALGDFGDSVIRLATANGTLSVSDYFTPKDQQHLADADLDLGSGGAMVLPDSVGGATDPHLLVACGKEGLIYLINRDSMGGFDPIKDHVVQEVRLAWGTGMWNSPAYFNGRIYYRASGDVLRAFAISDGVMSTTPVAVSALAYDYPGSTPSISSYDTANGIVWDIQGVGDDATLHAYDATTLRELYNSNQVAARDGLGPFVKFTTPAIADGKVFVGTGNAVAVFGLLSPPMTVPAAPGGLTAAPISSSQIALHWVVSSGNQSVFQIERSTDGLSFTPLALTSANASSFTDSKLPPNTQYFYRVRATNAVGDSDYSAVASATTPFAAILARRLFYNRSRFAAPSAGPSPLNDQAVDATKDALVPGQLASFANVSGYSRGINGVMIDVANLGTTPEMSDFIFDVGSGGNGSGWSPAPAPQFEPQAYVGDGVNGSTRVQIIWPDHAIQNEWLRVTVRADANTGLASPDVFYFGSLVGLSDKAAAGGQWAITPADEAAARSDPHGLLNAALVTNANDFNHDGRVDVLDQLIARRDLGAQLAELDLTTSAAMIWHPAVPRVRVLAAGGAQAALYAASELLHRGTRHAPARARRIGYIS